jgi:hypothetical protein
VILPTKHVRLESSLIGIGAELLPILRENPATMTTLWEGYRSFRARMNKPIPYGSFVLALDLLHALGLVALDRENRVVVTHGTG